MLFKKKLVHLCVHLLYDFIKQCIHSVTVAIKVSMCSIDILMVFILTIKCFLLRFMKIWRKQYCRKITHPRQYVNFYLQWSLYSKPVWIINNAYFCVLQCYSLVFWRYLFLHLLGDIPRLSKYLYADDKVHLF